MTERLARSAWANARWMVVAPHPDDETIGAGALIHEASKTSRLGGIVYLTDGAGSHPPGTAGLVPGRHREATRALRVLGAGAVNLCWLDWRDGRPKVETSADFRRDAQRLGAILRYRRIDAVAVSDLRDAHCDHVAAYQLTRAATRAARRRVALFTYQVWSTPDLSGRQRVRTNPMPLGLRRRALRCHRSQLSPLFGNGFRLPAAAQRMPAADLLTFRGPWERA